MIKNSKRIELVNGTVLDEKARRAIDSSDIEPFCVACHDAVQPNELYCSDDCRTRHRAFVLEVKEILQIVVAQNEKINALRKKYRIRQRND